MKDRQVEIVYTQAGEMEVGVTKPQKPENVSNEVVQDPDAIEEEIGITYGTNPNRNNGRKPNQQLKSAIIKQ